MAKTEARPVDEGVPLTQPLPFDWAKADRYARNYVLLRIEDMARGLEGVAGDTGISAGAATLAEKRAYAARAAISLLSRSIVVEES